MVKYCFIVLCFILIEILAFGQDTVPLGKWLVQKAGAPIVKPAGISYFFRKYDMEQGLENPYILRVRQNKDGEILFGTAGNGAGIFDGESFIIYNITNGLKNNVVQDIHEDKKGNLWFATTDGGINMYNGRTFTYFDKNNGLPDNSVWVIYEDRKGNLWFGFENGGVCCYNYKSFRTLTTKDGLCSQNIKEIFEDNKGNLWFGSEDSGLSIFDGKTFKNYNTINGLTDNHVYGINEDHNGKIWIATYGGGLYSFDKGKFNYFGKESGLSNMYLCDVICDKTGNIWVASSGGGMFRFNGESFTPYSVSEGFSNNVVLSLLEDKYGNIWAGTYGSGICEYTAKQFSYFSENEGLPGNIIKSIVNASNSGLFFSTSGNGFCVYNGKEFKSYSIEQGLSSTYVLCSVLDSENNLWLGTSGGGICIFDGNSFYNLTKDQGLRTNYFLSLATGKKGEIYAGGYGGGLTIIKNNNIVHYGPKDSLPSVFINAIVEDFNNTVWIGTETGLYKLSNGKIKQVFADIFNKNNPVTSLFSNEQKGLMIGSNGRGLYYLVNNHLENISIHDGLCNNYIKSIIIDNSSGVWLGTANGISYLKSKVPTPNSLNDYIIKNYNRPEGYTGSSCLNNSIAIDRQQRIWIGTGRKLLCFDPSKENENTHAPIVKFKKINLFFEDVNWQNLQDSGIVSFKQIEPWSNIPIELVLPYYKNHLTFTFKGINLNCPEKTTYRFILEGLENEWSPASSEERATYSNVPPGKYLFKVIAINENGIPSASNAQLCFEITPPWWQQTWFRILVVILLILIVIIIIKLRERKLVKDKRILEATVKERTAEVVKQRDEILTKNVILNQQKEEISAQRDEIESQMEEIATQRDLVVTQKEHIEEIHKEVTDSINYAERIQRSFLATKELLDENLKEYFVFFQPKAVVSGDFYWASKLKNGNFILATADSTGHGVPGAIMSILNISSLEKAVEQGICDPSEILNHTRNTIIERLKKDGSPEGGKDGMDASLICFDFVNQKFTYSAANNPIWIIREHHMIELNPDKMPVGKHDKDQIPFTQHEFQLQNGDIIYTFTDGLPDQFGGPKGKKFKYTQLKELFISFNSKTMLEQKQMIEESLQNWKGNLEQVDDITILGFKI